ncbi:hypothetical protein Amal_04035 [Acetobacter malorum]|uniref:Uncharacterized protein n=1 Tax=Acetobacter malorum TaxID=178901 RepID=A0A177G074_9PROT|nr:hypothetical protein Amal_04035 [Acetobacter malorum]
MKVFVVKEGVPRVVRGADKNFFDKFGNSQRWLAPGIKKGPVKAPACSSPRGVYLIYIVKCVGLSARQALPDHVSRDAENHAGEKDGQRTFGLRHGAGYAGAH